MQAVGQEDFSLGIYNPGFKIEVDDEPATDGPAGSVLRADNAFIDPRGTLKSRGEIAQQITGADLDAAYDVTLLWSGLLLPGRRDVLVARDVSAGVPASNQQDNLRVVDPTDKTQIALAIGAAHSGGGAIVFGDRQPTVAGNMLIFNNYNAFNPISIAYGGSLLAASFGPVTIHATQGSPTITIPAGGVNGAVDVGMLAGVWNADTTGLAVVKSVDSDTQITMDRPWRQATTTTASLEFLPDAVIDVGLPDPTAQPQPLGRSVIFGAAAGRLLSLWANEFRFSDGVDPDTADTRTEIFPVGNKHVLPDNAEGLALATVRDTEFVFTSVGLFTISNLAYEIVDGQGNPQQPIQLVSETIIALSGKAIVGYHNSVIAPCRDGIYILDGVSQPVDISGGFPWAEQVRAGAQIGQAVVYQGYFLLPVGMVQSNNSLAWFTYCIRLTPVTTKSGGTYFPTATITPPAKVTCWTVGAAGELLAAGDKAQGLLDASGIFSAAVTDLDWTGDAVNMFMTSRFRLGTKALVRRVRVRHRVNDTSGSSVFVDIYRPGGTLTSISLPPSANDGNTYQAIDPFYSAIEADVLRVNVQKFGVSLDYQLTGIEVQYRSFSQ